MRKVTKKDKLSGKKRKNGDNGKPDGSKKRKIMSMKPKTGAGQTKETETSNDTTKVIFWVIHSVWYTFSNQYMFFVDQKFMDEVQPCWEIVSKILNFKTVMGPFESMKQEVSSLRSMIEKMFFSFDVNSESDTLEPFVADFVENPEMSLAVHELVSAVKSVSSKCGKEVIDALIGAYDDDDENDYEGLRKKYGVDLRQMEEKLTIASEKFFDFIDRKNLEFTKNL